MSHSNIIFYNFPQYCSFNFSSSNGAAFFSFSIYFLLLLLHLLHSKRLNKNFAETFINIIYTTKAHYFTGKPRFGAHTDECITKEEQNTTTTHFLYISIVLVIIFCSHYVLHHLSQKKKNTKKTK